jgi:PadR family transcriptional regulator, regulatory protein PadR
MTRPPSLGEFEQVVLLAILRLDDAALGDATPQRGGRPKRYFAVTKAGRSALVSAQQAYRSLLEGLNLLGGDHA